MNLRTLCTKQLLTVPHSWFSHFYLLGSVTNGASNLQPIGALGMLTRRLQAPLWLSRIDAASSQVRRDQQRFCPSPNSLCISSPGTLATLILFQMHLARRALERRVRCAFAATSALRTLTCHIHLQHVSGALRRARTHAPRRLLFWCVPHALGPLNV